MATFNTNETEEEFIERIIEELRAKYQSGGFKGSGDIDPKPVPQPPRETE